MKIPIVLSIAGFDPTGGAGVSSDLAVFKKMNTYGLGVMTAVTSQNTTGVQDSHPISSHVVARQLEVLEEDLTLDSVKTGQIPNQAVAREIVKFLRRWRGPVVVDPVFSPTAGKPLSTDEAIRTVIHEVLPRATVMTPTVKEAEIILKAALSTRADMEKGARQLHERYGGTVVLKGADFLKNSADDLVFTEEGPLWLRRRKENVGSIHGTGCQFSAAICAGLAHGLDNRAAIEKAKDFMTLVLREGRFLAGKGRSRLLFF